MMAPKVNDTAHELLHVTMLLLRAIAAHLREHDQGLSPAHVGILVRLDEAPCNLTELARHQSVRLPTMSRSITLLVAKGLAERTVTPSNRRQTIVRITTSGRRALALVKRHNERLVAGMLAKLDPGEHAKVHTGLQILGRMFAPNKSIGGQVLPIAHDGKAPRSPISNRQKARPDPI